MSGNCDYTVIYGVVKWCGTRRKSYRCDRFRSFLSFHITSVVTRWFLALFIGVIQKLTFRTVVMLFEGLQAIHVKIPQNFNWSNEWKEICQNMFELCLFVGFVLDKVNDIGLFSNRTPYFLRVFVCIFKC